MTGTVTLLAALAGLLNFAAGEEQALLAADGFGPGSGGGSPDNWAAVPLVAHDNQFKGQQAERIRCLLAGQVPPVYGEIDHSSAEVYQGYCAQARAGQPDQAARTLAEAIEAHPDLRANASRDPDLRVVREACP